MQPNGWQQPQNCCQDINLDILFNTPNFTSAQLIHIDNIVEQSRKQNDKMTQMLISNQLILDQLFDICLRPTHINNTQLGPISSQHTYTAVEILSNLGEKFSQYLLGNTNQQVFNEDDQNVVTQQKQLNESKSSIINSPMVTKVFKLLHDAKPLQQTALWYMYKIGTTACYSNPAIFIQLFTCKQIGMLLMQHVYSNSILDWVIKLMQIQDNNSFFQNQKLVVFKYLVQSIQQQTDKQLKLSKYQNYQTILNTLLQKMEDRFDKSKYSSLAKNIFTQKYPIQFVIDQLSNISSTSVNKVISDEQNLLNKQIQKECILILQKYLHFSSNYRTNISSIVFNNNTINNSTSRSVLGNGMFGNNNHNNSNSGHALDVSVLCEIVLQQNVYIKIKQYIHSQISSISQKAGQHSKIYTIALLKLIKTIFVTLDNSQTSYIDQILSISFVNYLLRLMIYNKYCNIVHNIVKDILLVIVHKSYQNIVRILYQQQCIFLSLISQMNGKQNSSINQYQTQIYTIFQSINKKGMQQQHMHVLEQAQNHVQNYQSLVQRIGEKTKLYSFMIGGNPRKQSSCWGDSSQDQKLFTFSYNNSNGNANNSKNQSKLLTIFNSNNINGGQQTSAGDIIIGKVEHWVDCDDLPLDSDQSKDESLGNLDHSQTYSRPEQGSQNYQPAIMLNSKQIVKNSRQTQNILQSQLARRFKTIGVVQCEQQQIRIPKSKHTLSSNRYNKQIWNNKQNSSSDHQQEQNDYNLSKIRQHRYSQPIQPMQLQLKIDSKQQIDQSQTDDKVQIQLQRQIQILQNKRRHPSHQHQNEDDSPEIKIRIKKTVDSLQGDDSLNIVKDVLSVKNTQQPEYANSFTRNCQKYLNFNIQHIISEMD